MATAISTVPITICPPGAAKNAVLDEYSHIEATSRQAVQVNFRGGDNWETTGFDWGDYKRCSTQTKKKLASGRKLLPPEWVFRTETLRAVIVRQMEMRAGFVRPQPGTEVERLQRAQDCIARRIPPNEEDLNRMCKRLVALKAEPRCDGAVVRKLSIAIEGLDSFLLAARKPDRGAGTLALIATLYFSDGFDSVEVASEVGMKPPAVRAQIWRMRQTWERMQKEAPAGWHPRIRINLLKGMPVPAPIEEAPAGWHPRIRINLLKRMLVPAPTKVKRPHRATLRQCQMCGADCLKYASKFCGKECRVKSNNATFNALRRARWICVNCAGPLPPHAKKFCAGCKSRQFVSLFEKARAFMRHPERTHCRHGHRICEANAHAGDLRRLGIYSCNLCWQASNARYKLRCAARRAAALQRIRNIPLQ